MKGRDGKMYVVKGGRWAKVISKKGNPKGELLNDYKPAFPKISEDKTFHEHVYDPDYGRPLIKKYMTMIENGDDDDVILEVVRTDARNYSQEDDVEDMIAPVIADLDL